MARISFADGRWLDLRPMTVNAQLAVWDWGQDEPPSEDDREGRAAFNVGRLRSLRDLLDRHLIEASWEGGTGELTMDEMIGVLPQWSRASEDDALPQA